MAKFSEIIGSIAKDFVQMQATSDLASLDLLSKYQQDEILRYFEAPRFTVSDINMKLKFAISDEGKVTQTDASVSHARKEWISILKKDMVDYFPEIVGPNRKRLIRAFDKAIKDTNNPNLDLKNSLAGKKNTTINKTTNYLINIYKKLPEEFTKKLPNDEALKKVIQDNVNATFESKISFLRKTANAKATVERDIDIIIEKDKLESLSNDQIHEITFNLSPDFIKIAEDE